MNAASPAEEATAANERTALLNNHHWLLLHNHLPPLDDHRLTLNNDVLKLELLHLVIADRNLLYLHNLRMHRNLLNLHLLHSAKRLAEVAGECERWSGDDDQDCEKVFHVFALGLWWCRGRGRGFLRFGDIWQSHEFQ